MNTDLQKKIEKAAEYAGIATYNKAYENAVKTFKAGAEYGYKEAIAQAKEYLEKKMNMYRDSYKHDLEIHSEQAATYDEVSYKTIRELIKEFFKED